MILSSALPFGIAAEPARVPLASLTERAIAAPAGGAHVGVRLTLAIVVRAADRSVLRTAAAETAAAVVPFGWLVAHGESSFRSGSNPCADGGVPAAAAGRTGRAADAAARGDDAWIDERAGSTDERPCALLQM